MLAVVIGISIVCIILILYIVLKKPNKNKPCVCPDNNTIDGKKLEDNELDDLFDNHKVPDVEFFTNTEPQLSYENGEAKIGGDGLNMMLYNGVDVKPDVYIWKVDAQFKDESF